MSSDVTARDRVWAALVKMPYGPFTVQELKVMMEDDGTVDDYLGLAYGSSSSTLPSDETIRRVLRAAAELDVIDHDPGSKYYAKGRHVQTWKWSTKP